MAGQNTSILIKRSTGTTSPVSLKAGEFAYSYASNTLFLGTSTGTGVVNVGGLLYTQTIDAATSANTAGTLVKRDSNFGFYGALYGNANTATKLLNVRNFNVSSSDITSDSFPFDGTANVTLNSNLTTTGVTSGTYGGQSQIPVFTVDNKGRLTSASNVAISTTLTFNDDKGHTGSVNLLNDQLDVKASNGITSFASGNTLTISTDNTVLRSNTSSVGSQTIGTDLFISGNLVITGTQTYVNTSVVQTTDSMILLAANNTVGDVIDIGFVGRYNNGSSNLATGLVRDAGNKAYYLFAGVDANAISNANTIANNYFTTSNTATLYANINAPTITTGTFTATGQANTNANLGVGGNLYVSGNTVINGNTIITGSANTTGDLGVGNNLYVSNNSVINGGSYVVGAYTGSYIDGIVVDYVTGRGRISVGAADAISFYNGGVGSSLLMNLTSSGIITTATWQGQTIQTLYGGTGQTAFTSGAILVGNGTGSLQTLANTSLSTTGTGAQNNTITSVTVDAYGRTTALTYSQILGLTVPQGGTGVSSFTANGIVYGNGSGSMQVTAAAGVADQTWSNQLLTTTNAGVPVWTTTLDGGSF
jgi:hypothetical protein